ncbi:hypothetical protein [Hyphomicrobium sp. LHD-15]|uniref:hypothetical protein n=1 Tax=Hyphomicrobium sp. LHD-15 TaxID=3072142 RepID=UPI00280FCAFF|nr:hypothetical protein [Hyphomicrobium sp. LHD-15]MDQ8700532.1 hypothetical protein [Hyphomicrobium sp. LHD-15]
METGPEELKDMNLQDPSARRATVSVRKRSTMIKPRPSHTQRAHRPSALFTWIKRESLALLALSGAALTVLAELGKTIPLAPQISDLLTKWQDMTRAIWRPPLELAGVTLHPDLVAALNVAAFMALLGAGARVSASFSTPPLAPIAFDRFFDDQTWPSLLVFAALCMTFLIGHGANPDNVLTIWGSPEIGKYAFAIIVTAGYFAGDFIGHRAFHLRLYRLVALVAILVGANFALIYGPGLMKA